MLGVARRLLGVADSRVGIQWKVGDSEVKNVFPGPEVAEPEASGGQSKAERGAVHLLRALGCLQCRCLGPTLNGADVWGSVRTVLFSRLSRCSSGGTFGNTHTCQLLW